MKTLTYTIIAGNKSCPNDCPICISKMTPDYGIKYKPIEVNWGKFEEATTIALNHKAENVLITGKGEPTLFPGQITQYMIRLYQKPFDRREIQTDGSLIAKGGLYDQFLDVWKDLGLNTISLSIYHHDKEKNKQVFQPRSGTYFNLPNLIERITSKDINVRLSCVMLDNYMDNVEEISNLIQFSKDNNVFQLTLRRADRPKHSLDETVASYVDKNRLSDNKFRSIYEWVEKEGDFCYNLPHGASVFELDGQNICLSSGLTKFKKGDEDVRQLIFFPQGWLTTSWENVQGGRLL